LSTFTTYDAVAVLPATSVHVPVTSTDDPSPDEVVDVSQFVASIPEPPADQGRSRLATGQLTHGLVLLRAGRDERVSPPAAPCDR
jgi:hypothetical protein